MVWAGRPPQGYSTMAQAQLEVAARLRKAFDTFDVDGSGRVDYNELNKMLRQGASVELAE